MAAPPFPANLIASSASAIASSKDPLRSRKSAIILGLDAAHHQSTGKRSDEFRHRDRGPAAHPLGALAGVQPQILDDVKSAGSENRKQTIEGELYMVGAVRAIVDDDVRR